MESLTVLRARGRRLAKMIYPGRVEGYDRARTFDLHPLPLATLDELADLLRRLTPRHDCAVVRGEPVGEQRAVRRLLHGEGATLRDVPRQWLALDMEGIDRPAGLPATDLCGCAALAVATLPAAFGAARCIVQASGSHGIKPDIRLRLWYWCSRPMAGAELKRWLAGTPADPSIFGAAQLIYTAAPVLAPGVQTPLRTRLAELSGAPVVHCPSAAALAPPPRKRAAAVPSPATGSRYVDAALVSAAHRIASAGHRHPVIMAEALGLARFVRAGTLAEPLFRSVLREAAFAAGKQDRQELERIESWALAHAGEAHHA